MRKLIPVVIAMSVSLTAQAAPDLRQVTQAVEQWRSERVGRLTGAAGWLTLVGLYWLDEGANTFGRTPNNNLILDRDGVPNQIGTFLLKQSKVTFTVAKGVTVLHEGEPVTTLELVSDIDGKQTTLAVGSLRFFVVDRAGKLGVRVRDTEHPARKQFQGIQYYPIGADWAIDANFEPYAPTRRIAVVNVLGQTEQMVSPGAVVFTKDGTEYRLDTVLELPDDQELFIMFADSTNGRETYGGGRYIYIPLPKDGRALVDFNRAYNPPCVFSDFATCPLPPKQNRLMLRVTAGELRYVNH
jgi:uncharacterized protein